MRAPMKLPGFGLALLLFGCGCPGRHETPVAATPVAKGPAPGAAPASKQPASPGPGAILQERGRRPVPALQGSGEAGRESVRAFIAWAGASTLSEAEDVRKALHQAQNNPEIARALIAEVEASQKSDATRTLIVLSLLGELRSPAAEPFLIEFIQRPLPTGEPAAEGEILAESAAAILQARAVDGLAYLKSTRGDAAVIDAAAKHPSRIVRAEAISAYLWNHSDSSAARERLASRLRPDERIFLDRVRREAGEKAESFNRKLAIYLKSHPELRPPAPQRLVERAKKKAEAAAERVGEPPRF